MNEISTDPTAPHISNSYLRKYNKESSPIHSYNISNRNNNGLHPYLHTFNSEWIDSPDSSPSKSTKLYYNNNNNNIINNMPAATTTTTHISSKYETPSKLVRSNFNYITPSSDSKFNDGKLINRNSSSNSNEAPNDLLSSSILSNDSTDSSPLKHNIKNADIFYSMINTIVGKDKLAKVGQYSLRLLLHYSSKTESYLSNDLINIKTINERYYNKEKQLELIRNFLKHPKDFVRIVIILICSVFKLRFQGMAKGLSTYRQFLRFGKTPFRIRDLYNKFHSNYDAQTKTVNNKIFNKSLVGDLISLYYGVNDESTLLYKLNLFDNKKLYDFVSRHESIAWYYESWYALYNAYLNLTNINKEEMDIKIQIQVKKKAKVLSKQLLGGTAIRTIDNFPNHGATGDDSTKDLKLLNDIKFKKFNAYLDIYKNLSDIVFNSYSVFHIKLPFDTLQIWMGISASSLSSIKIYRETKKRLIEEESRKKV